MQQGGGGGENRYMYGNACNLIDSLPHMKAEQRRRRASKAMIWMAAVVSVGALIFAAHKKGYLKKMQRLKGVKLEFGGSGSGNNKNGGGDASGNDGGGDYQGGAMT